MIKMLQASGDTMGAQKIILAELNKEARLAQLLPLPRCLIGSRSRSATSRRPSGRG